jgi:hypothetical protein
MPTHRSVQVLELLRQDGVPRGVKGQGPECAQRLPGIGLHIHQCTVPWQRLSPGILQQNCCA